MLRIFSAAALCAVVVVGCGSASRPQPAAVHGLSHALAQDWERQAAAIATAASAGDSCGARRLASTLRADVAASKQNVPRLLRTPLLSGVNALAGRITCTAPAPPKPPHEKHGHHGHRGHHGQGDGGGDGGGNEQ